MSEEKNEMDAKIGNWNEEANEIENRANNRYEDDGRLPYMKFDKQGKYVIRLVGKHVTFLRWWKPFPKNKRLITHKSYLTAKLDPARNAGFWPTETCAIHVLDRGDKDSPLKILEKGFKSALFTAFRTYSTNNDLDPASTTQGPEFVVEVTYKDGKSKDTAEYTVQPKAKPCPLTEEEIVMIKAKHQPLTTMYKASPIEKIQEAWNDLPENEKIKKDEPKKGSNGKKDAAKEPSTPLAEEGGQSSVLNDKVDGAPAESDDFFGKDGNDKGDIAF